MSVARALALSVMAALCACGPSTPRYQGTTGTVSVQSPASRSLHALFNDEWEYELREYPVWASEQGDMRYADRWNDESLAAIARREQHQRELVLRLNRILREELSREDMVSFDLFKHNVDDAIASQPFKLHLLAINQRNGIQTADEIADALPFDSVRDFQNWNARLKAFPQYMEQTIALLQEGVRLGIVHPRIVMQRIPAQIDKQIVADGTKSPFYEPYAKKNVRVPENDRASFASEAKRLIETGVVPAFTKLKTFFETTYLPACKADVGAWQLPNGAALYADRVRSHTTTKLTADEVHAIGLREVARIRGELETLKQKTGYSGTLREFYTFLRTDPRFFYKDGQELLLAYRELAKRVDPLLVKVFKRLPRTPYGVAPIPDHIAPDTTTAYYRPPADDGSRAGTYFVNLYKPEARPKWEMTALTLHEAVPGHHLQIALAMEQENLPKFRRHADYTAFVEGWALYSESLGEEMGVYDDPYSKIGQLTYEMWRAVRLVVDTGIHHLKWDRQRAIDFFLENAPKAELDVINEVDRYIVWPGQALAYKIGELRIKELRKKKAAQLGAKFDLKAFHEAVLQNGPLPLDILERQVMEERK